MVEVWCCLCGLFYVVSFGLVNGSGCMIGGVGLVGDVWYGGW